MLNGPGPAGTHAGGASNDAIMCSPQDLPGTFYEMPQNIFDLSDIKSCGLNMPFTSTFQSFFTVLIQKFSAPESVSSLCQGFCFCAKKRYVSFFRTRGGTSCFFFAAGQLARRVLNFFSRPTVGGDASYFFFARESRSETCPVFFSQPFSRSRASTLDMSFLFAF